MRLPATAPTVISISATETAIRTEMSDANNASPSQSADCSQTLAMIPLPFVRQGSLGKSRTPTALVACTVGVISRRALWLSGG
jgi:hypothetical protein